MIIDRLLFEHSSKPCGSYARARDLVIEPLANIEIEPSPFKVIEERSSQPFTEPGRRFPSIIVMQKVILGEALEFRPEDTQAMGGGIQPHRAVSGDCKTMPKGRLKEICRDKLADSLE